MRTLVASLSLFAPRLADGKPDLPDTAPGVDGIRLTMHFWLAVFILLALPMAAQSPASTLAPTGTLRGVFLGSNPVQGRVNAATGEATGPVPDLVRELAKRIG